jgi:hypothetical protein
MLEDQTESCRKLWKLEEGMFLGRAVLIKLLT